MKVRYVIVTVATDDNYEDDIRESEPQENYPTPSEISRHQEWYYGVKYSRVEKRYYPDGKDL